MKVIDFNTAKHKKERNVNEEQTTYTKQDVILDYVCGHYLMTTLNIREAVQKYLDENPTSSSDCEEFLKWFMLDENRAMLDLLTRSKPMVNWLLKDYPHEHSLVNYGAMLITVKGSEEYGGFQSPRLELLLGSNEHWVKVTVEGHYFEETISPIKSRFKIPLEVQCQPKLLTGFGIQPAPDAIHFSTVNDMLTNFQSLAYANSGTIQGVDKDTVYSYETLHVNHSNLVCVLSITTPKEGFTNDEW